MKFNAFRWLRDSGFNPVAFAISNATESTQTEITAGLLEYFRRERIFPKRDHVGELTFGEDRDLYADWTLPVMLQPRFKAGVYTLVFGLPCLAVAMIAWTLKKPRRPTICSKKCSGPSPQGSRTPAKKTL